jgi:hypothetical protein
MISMASLRKMNGRMKKAEDLDARRGRVIVHTHITGRNEVSESRLKGMQTQ